MNRPLEISENVILAPFTSLGIGGKARYFVRAETEGQVTESVEFAKKNGLKLFVLGGGSNVLVSDKGFDGLVLQISLMGVNGSESKPVLNPELETRNSKQLTVGAGEDWDDFVAFCVENDLAGVECLSGIPGFVGGTPVQNVGAYGQEVSETIVAVRCFDRNTARFVDLKNSDCRFSYRASIFNSTERDRYIVLSVMFSLHKGGAPKVVYKDLIDRFGDRRPTLSEVREAVLAVRRSKSMVIDAGDPNSKSAGSFFKNPVVDRDRIMRLKESFEALPFFEFGDKAKIPAAWLIENAGFCKGYALGNVGISSNHTLALINRGDATAAEVIVLKKRIQKAVDAKFGIDLDPEPVFVGF